MHSIDVCRKPPGKGFKGVLQGTGPDRIIQCGQDSTGQTNMPGLHFKAVGMLRVLTCTWLIGRDIPWSRINELSSPEFVNNGMARSWLVGKRGGQKTGMPICESEDRQLGILPLRLLHSVSTCSYNKRIILGFKKTACMNKVMYPISALLVDGR
jgi:hypothetical protein